MGGREKGLFMDKEERIVDIEYWWGDASSGSFDYGGGEQRVYSAFQSELLALPEEDFELFLEQRPFLLCLPKIRGKVFRKLIAVPLGAKEMQVNFIYLPPNVKRLSEKNLVNTIAHEIAHLILGHQNIGGKPRSETEAGADALSVRWGFEPCYSKSQLRQLKAREVRIRQQWDRHHPHHRG